MEKKEKIVKER